MNMKEKEGVNIAFKGFDLSNWCYLLKEGTLGQEVGLRIKSFSGHRWLIPIILAI
jgi:hypothetical protein